MRPLAAALCLALAAPAAAEPGGWEGDLRLLAGTKALDEGDWGPFDKLGEGGLQLDLRPPGWTVALAMNLLGAGRSDELALGGQLAVIRTRTSELQLGVRKTWKPGPRFRPSAAGGLTLARASVETVTSFGTLKLEDEGAGLWVAGALGWTLGSLDLGVELKLSGARVDLLGDERSAGGAHLGLLAGWHWD